MQVLKISISVQIEISLDEHPPESSGISYACAMSTSDIKFTSEDHNNQILVGEMAGLTNVSDYLSRGHIGTLLIMEDDVQSALRLMTEHCIGAKSQDGWKLPYLKTS